jgi:glyoxylate/hydroxypyruvate reductase A
MRLYFAADLPPDEATAWLAALQAAAPGHEWTVHGQASVGEPARVVQADVAVVANPPPGSLAQVQGLRFIQSLWAGVDRLLADPTVPAHLPLARMVDPTMTAAMVQSALWAVTALHRGFFHYAEQQRRAVWHQLDQRRASEVRVLVLGLGTMGAAVASALVAQGYKVTAWRRGGAEPGSGMPVPPVALAADTASGPVPAGVDVRQGPQAWREPLAAADVVINLLPLTPDTRGLFNADVLSRFKPSAALVNFGRGGHVVEADLLAALNTGRLAHAVLDVFTTEPLRSDHPFWRHPQVTVLPHVAALTDLGSAAEVVAANLSRLQSGQPLLHLVDRRRGY